MVDLKEQCFIVPGEQQDMFNSNPLRSSSSNQAVGEPIKSCTGCHTTTTPLWRGGPAGPKTLCNACGIKYHKKRRALLGMESGKTEKPKAKKKKLMRSSSSSASTSCSNGSDEEEKSPIRVPLKIKMVLKKFHGGGADQFFSRNLGEEEQAAILLMALSCGSVYA